MLDQLLLGVPASTVFRDLQAQHGFRNAEELYEILMRKFPEISPAAYISILRWLGAGSALVSDAQLDALILHFLQQAGYASAENS